MISTEIKPRSRTLLYRIENGSHEKKVDNLLWGGGGGDGGDFRTGIRLKDIPVCF